MRNIGGSIGISVAQTVLVRRSDYHQKQIVGSIPQVGYWFEQRVHTLAGLLGTRTAPANATGAAQGRIYQQVGQQALLWAFVDIFRWTALLSFGCVLFVWLFRKVKPGKAPAGLH